jgi:hypothetical protein
MYYIILNATLHEYANTRPTRQQCFTREAAITANIERIHFSTSNATGCHATARSRYRYHANTLPPSLIRTPKAHAPGLHHAITRCQYAE